MIDSVFIKLYESHSICHIHPNNCCGVTIFNGIAVPSIVEILFTRSDEITDKLRTPISLPHPLDCKNVSSYPEIQMLDFWWDKI